MRALRAVLAAAAALVIAPAAWGAPGDPGTGIASTVHDFASGGLTYTTDNGTPTTNTTAIGLCTFCHTPHKAQTTKLLWNHTLSSNSFTWSDATTTTAGTSLPTLVGSTYNGVSTKCLSCHDGSVAIGDVAWFDAASHNGGSAINSFTMGSDGDNTFLIGSGGDLKGNHPIGVPYPYNNAANTYNGSTTGGAAILTEWQADPTNLGGVSNIRLFHDTGSEKAAGAVAGTTGIECSSCHDPHNKQAVGDYFLRGQLTGTTQADGYICLQCHIK